MQVEKTYSQSIENGKESIDPNRDHWGQRVEQYEPTTGAGERCERLRCGTRHDIALVAGTVPDVESNKWEEFRRCTICGAEGSLRVNGTERRWTGRIGPVEESIR